MRIQSQSADPLETCEEVIIPPARPAPVKNNEKPVKIADLPPIAKGCFPVSQGTRLMNETDHATELRHAQ